MTEPYRPTFNVAFARQVPRNVTVIVKAQQADAFQKIFEDYAITLPPFIEFNRSVHKKVAVPCFTAYRRRVRGIRNDEGQWLSSVPVFGLISTAEGADEDEAQDLCELYMLAVDSIVRSAARSDIFAGMAGLKGHWSYEITDHIYYDAVPIGTRYRQAVEGVLEIGLREE